MDNGIKYYEVVRGQRFEYRPVWFRKLRLVYTQCADVFPHQLVHVFQSKERRFTKRPPSSIGSSVPG